MNERKKPKSKYRKVLPYIKRILDDVEKRPEGYYHPSELKFIQDQKKKAESKEKRRFAGNKKQRDMVHAIYDTRVLAGIPWEVSPSPTLLQASSDPEPQETPPALPQKEGQEEPTAAYEEDAEQAAGFIKDLIMEGYKKGYKAGYEAARRSVMHAFEE